MAGQTGGVVSLPPLPITCTVDDALGGKLHVAQPEKGFRFGTDAVLLGAALILTSGQRVLDMGAGTGIVGLCLASRYSDISLTALEKDPNMAAIARHNMALNGVEDRATIICGDVGQKDLRLGNNSFDAVVFNPPYFDPSQHQSAASDQRSLARQGDGQDLSVWFKAARRYLKPGGQVALVLRATALPEAVPQISIGCGGVQVIPIWSKRGHPAKTVVLTAVKGSKAPLTLTAGVTLHRESGGQTAAATHILRDGGPLRHVLDMPDLNVE